MPSSTWVHSSDVQQIVFKLKPQSILDVGVGFGRWGFLLRELLDIFRGRYAREEWKTCIDGVEVFESYITPMHRYLYDKIMVGDAEKLVQGMAPNSYDVIILGDVLEHFEKEQGKDFLNGCCCVVKKAVIVCIPIGKGYPQGTVLGNVDETHRAVWEFVDFENDSRLKQLLKYKEKIKGRPYCVAVLGK